LADVIELDALRKLRPEKGPFHRFVGARQPEEQVPCIANQTSVTRRGHYIAMVVGLGGAEFAVVLLVYFIVKPTVTRVGSKTDKVVPLLGFSGRSGYI
jgi:hypothetical protein